MGAESDPGSECWPCTPVAPALGGLPWRLFWPAGGVASAHPSRCAGAPSPGLGHLPHLKAAPAGSGSSVREPPSCPTQAFSLHGFLPQQQLWAWQLGGSRSAGACVPRVGCPPVPGQLGTECLACCAGARLGLSAPPSSAHTRSNPHVGPGLAGPKGGTWVGPVTSKEPGALSVEPRGQGSCQGGCGGASKFTSKEHLCVAPPPGYSAPCAVVPLHPLEWPLVELGSLVSSGCCRLGAGSGGAGVGVAFSPSWQEFQGRQKDPSGTVRFTWNSVPQDVPGASVSGAKTVAGRRVWLFRPAQWVASGRGGGAEARPGGALLRVHSCLLCLPPPGRSTSTTTRRMLPWATWSSPSSTM